MDYVKYATMDIIYPEAIKNVFKLKTAMNLSLENV